VTLLSAWAWLLAALAPLVLLERWIHRHLQGIFLLVSRDADISVLIYSLLMLPGVLVHETSHWVAATLLFVRAGRFSVIPRRLPNGTLRLGYVETERTDIVREALIGAAPLVFGTLAIIFVGYSRLGVGPVGQAAARGDLAGMLAAASAMTGQADFWLWLYLVFTIANSMLPSASDRRAWLPVLAGAVFITGLMFFAGLGPVLVSHLAAPLEVATRAVAAGFSLTVGLDLLFVPLIWLVEKGLVRLTGLKVEY
jgi:hypothetical protein